MKRNWLARFFDSLNQLIVNSEYSFLALVSTIVPWLVSVLPAMMTYTNVRYQIDFPQEVPDVWRNIMGVASGITAESLGILSMSTFFSFIAHNQKVTRKSEKLKWGAFVIPALTLLFYISIIVAVNIWMHIEPDSVVAQTVAIGGLSLLTIPAAMIVSVRNYRNELLKSYTDRTDKDRNGQISDRSGQKTDKDKIDWRTFRKSLSDEQLIDLSNLSKDDLEVSLNVPPKTAERLYKTYIPEELRKRGLT